MLSSRPAPEPAHNEGGILGFDSLPALIAFGALLLLLCTSPLMLSGFTPATYDFWPQTLFLLLGAGGALLLAISPDSKPRFDLTAWLLVGFLAWNGLSMLTTVYRHDSWLELARLFGGLLPFFAVRAFSNHRRANWILGAWVLGMTGITLNPILAFVQERSVGLAWPFYNQNLLANALSITLPVALVVPILVRRTTRSGLAMGLALLPFLICALGLLLTASKGGFLSALFALIVTSVLVLRAKSATVGGFIKKNKAAFGAGILVFLVLFGLVAAKTVLPRLQRARGADDNSTMFRAYIWRSTLNMAKDRPLLGFGPGSFPHTYSRYAQVGYTRSAHESWLQVAAEGGFPALLLLVGAMGTALIVGGRRLKSPDWPVVAGMSGAVAALIAHGCVDSGFQTTSIVIFLAVALALLTQREEVPAPSASRLNPFWLGVTLLLALAGNQTQKAANAEESLLQAKEFWKNGSPAMAVQKQQDAIAVDNGSARQWLNLGRWQEGSGGDGQTAFQTAAQLQPTVSINWASLARDAERRGSATEAEKFYDTALEMDPLNTSLLLERANFRLQSKNGQGFTDLEKIVSLWDSPLARYAPIEQNVNLDFARATMILAPQWKKQGKAAQLQPLIEHGLADCKRAKGFEAQNAEMRRETGGELGVDANDDLDALVSGLQQLQTGLK